MVGKLDYNIRSNYLARRLAEFRARAANSFIKPGGSYSQRRGKIGRLRKGRADEEKSGKEDERRYKLAEEAEEKDTMVHALREEPGSYTTTLKDGTEVTYAIRPTEDGFVAGWNATGLGASGKGHEERF